MKSPERPSQRGAFRVPVGFGLLAFLGIATFFLWAEHKAHIMGALPFLLLLLCLPLGRARRKILEGRRRLR